jgi:hypothetical protein
VRETKLTEEDVPFVQDELDNVMTIFYLIIEGIRFHKDDMQDAREKLCKSVKLYKAIFD